MNEIIEKPSHSLRITALALIDIIKDRYNTPTQSEPSLNNAVHGPCEELQTLRLAHIHQQDDVEEVLSDGRELACVHWPEENDEGGRPAGVTAVFLQVVQKGYDTVFGWGGRGGFRGCLIGSCGRLWL